MTQAMIRVRKARPADADAIGDVFLASRAETSPRPRPALTEAETRAYLAGLIDNPPYAAWVAERDGGIVGFVVLRDGWVDHLYVHPAWYRRGIGTRLLDAARRASPQGLRLFCSHCNHRARAFYAARGLIMVRSSQSATEGEPDLEYHWTGSGQRELSG